MIGRTLLEFSQDTRLEDLPDAVVHEARRYVLDAMGCALGGHAVDKGRIAAAHALRLGGAEEAAIIGTACRVGMTAAAFANAELINALDHDAIPHVVPITLPAVLAAAQARHRRGRDFVVALVVAHEIGQRLARASSAMIQSLTETGNTPDAFGINNESIVGGALGAARLLGLSGEQAAHAMGLAAYYCSVPVTRDWEEASPKSLVKYTPVGLMAQNALHAAMLAQAGFTGHPGVLDAPHGFARILRTGRWDTQVLTDQLGSRWWFLEQQYKPWPCCRFFHSQLDLLDGLMRAHAVLADDVVAIDTYGPPFVANPAPYEVRTHVDVQFSLPFCMALVAHGVPPGASWQTVPTLADGRLHGFAKRVRMHIDADAMARKRLDPRSWGARVEVTLADGRCLRAEAEHARGTNGTAVACSDDELEAKFRAHASAHLSPYKTDLAIDAIWHLEDLSDTQQLGNLLAPTL